MNQHIENFVEAKRIAVVGVSDRKFGGAIYKTLKKRGYRVIPVHPTKQLFDNDQCFSTLRDITGSVDAAIVAVSAASAGGVADDAIAAGLTRLWFQQGQDFSAAAQKAESAGIITVTGKCILMYTEPVTGIHAFHRWLARLFGKY